MENASNIFYFENSVNGKGDHDNLLAHEIAHQWFGDSASELDWHHVWLSEGFATYFTHLYNESTYGPDKRASDMLKDRTTVTAFNKKNPLPVVFSDLPESLLDILSANSYQKGSWVLHMLRQQVGDDAFWRGIRQYYKEYQQSNALTSDFQRVMEQSSGQNLANFFKQWLYTPGHPVLKASWVYNEKARAIELTIAQSQSGEPFKFPLEIGITSPGNLKTVEKLEINAKTGKFSIRSDKKPQELQLDPAVKLLFEGSFMN
jgi:aminopeptidase N